MVCNKNIIGLSHGMSQVLFFYVSQSFILCFLSYEKSMLLKNTNAEKFFRVAETGFVQGQKT